MYEFVFVNLYASNNYVYIEMKKKKKSEISFVINKERDITEAIIFDV